MNEKSLREAIQINREIIDGAAEGIILYDRELRYQVFNPFMERLTGKSQAEVLGKIAADVFPRLVPSGIQDALDRALQGEVVQVADALVPKHSAEGHDVWESCTFAPHRNSEGEIIGVIGLVRDVTDRHLAEETFRSIVIGTASATGSDFFPSLVRHMAGALHVRYAFITDCDDQKHAKALAFWKGEDFGENFEFDIADTPCEKVLHGEICHYKEGLTKLFPRDTGLAELGVESYLGVPMLDKAGRVIGHIAILDDKPMDRDPRAFDLVKIFAARASAELKRQRAEAYLQAALEQVRSLQKKLEAENVYLQEEISKEHNFEPLGSSRTLRVNVRIIAASNRDLEKAIQEGRFRADLYYRLNVLPITLPPLRQRRADIPLLTSFFVERFARQFGRQITGIAQDTMDLLSRYDWPGNIRELQNVIERAVVLLQGSVLKLGSDFLPMSGVSADRIANISSGTIVAASDGPYTLEEVERRHIQSILEKTSWVIEGERGAARVLDLHPNTLRSRMKKLGIERAISALDSSTAKSRGQQATA